LYQIILDLTAPTFEEIVTADSVAWNEAINLTFKLHDNYAGGQYRITSNSSYSKDWANWTDGATNTELISNLAAGTWSFILVYRDAHGNLGSTEVFFKTVEPKGIPTFSDMYLYLSILFLTIVMYLSKRHTKP
jgi:hypothetical protein